MGSFQELFADSTHIESGSTSQSHCLGSLPEDVIAQVLSWLSAGDVINCALTSRQLRDAVLRDSLWFLLCRYKWGHVTTIANWVKQESESLRKLRNAAQLSSSETKRFRTLYSTLQNLERLIGLWRSIGEGPRSSVFHFSWHPNCIHACELIFQLGSAPPSRLHFKDFTPLNTSVTAELVDHMNCVIKEHHDSGSGSGSPIAEAAAAVAVASLSLRDIDSSDVLGSSPEGSFHYEMASFMKAQVARAKSRSSKSKKRLARSPSQGFSSIPTITHLRRVSVPQPTPRHPLAGLWKCEVGRRGVQVLVVQYDFTGPAARIVATKVTGDECIPAGCEFWRCAAASVCEPWPLEEVELMADHLSGQAVEEGDLEDVLEGGHTAVAAAEAARKQVVSCFMGEGMKMDGGVLGRQRSRGRWVSGRLWLYDGGDMGFLWREDRALVDMQRIHTTTLGC